MSRPSHLRRVTSSAAPTNGLFTARVEEILPHGALLVRDLLPEDGSRPGERSKLEVRLALIGGYIPSVGDQLLIAGDPAQPLAIAVIEAARGPALLANDGARAEVVGGGIEFRDAEGRLLLRYLDGALEVAPSHGDLRLRAPSGRVQIEAGTDVCIHANRDLLMSASHSAQTTISDGHGGDRGGEGHHSEDLQSRIRLDGEGARVTGSGFELRARSARAITGRADLIATEIRASAQTIATHARKIETTAERVTLRAKEVASDVAGLFETRVGRLRSVVRGAFSLRAKSTSMKSEEDTSIDGRRVLLG